MIGGCRDATFQSEACAPMIVMDYNDFGPQAMAHELIGYAWWQWQSTGGGKPHTNYPVKVVVYAKGQKEEAMMEFPINKNEEQDFRYVSNIAAHDYLDNHLTDLNGESGFEALTLTLQRTKTRLRKEVCPQ